MLTLRSQFEAARRRPSWLQATRGLNPLSVGRGSAPHRKRTSWPEGTSQTCTRSRLTPASRSLSGLNASAPIPSRPGKGDAWSGLPSLVQIPTAPPLPAAATWAPLGLNASALTPAPGTVSRTRSDEYLCIGVSSTVSSEMRCTPAAKPGEFAVVAPRQRDFEYSADHLNGRWVITTNWDAKNFRIMTLADGQPWGDRGLWKELVPHSPDVFIEGTELFNGYMAIAERSGGLERVLVRMDDGKEQFVKADESAYSMGLAMNAEPGTDWLRYTYTSLATPASTYEVNVRTNERRLLKEQEVPGGFDKANYVTERLWATARDGTQVPVSVLYRKGFEKNGQAALYQYSYGSYGSSSDPGFNSNVFSLVDRGAVYAVAHIRGGQEMGRQWYEDGKLLNKANTFTDFIDVTDFLVKQGYAAPGRVAGMGGSAGGLLMGAVANLAPDKYRVMVAHVPFVDVVTTMLD